MSGRGTAGGVVFQAEVGAYIAGLILAQRPFSYLNSGLPGKPLQIYFEDLIPVDDISIQTDCGKIYIQAKRTVSLSNKKNTELASVVNQFVRQFRTGYVDKSNQRDLNPINDRLVLAVSDDTSASITRDLKEALDRTRTESATGLPKNIHHALNTFTALIKGEWFAETNTVIDDDELQKILSLCSIAVISDSLGHLIQECLREVVATAGDEIKLIEILQIWAANSTEKGVGGNIKTIRLALNEKISLAEPPNFRNDIYRLTNYTTQVVQRLKRFTEIEVPEGRFIIKRPVVNSITDAIQYGSLLVTGEPGAGKSAVLYQVARLLEEKEVVVIFTVEATITSYEDFRIEIGLNHSLLEVLEQISESRSSYLILDALDAVRGGTAETFYRKLIEDVLLLPNWKVIASVRSFDLRLGRHWHQLFKGLPPYIEHSEASFNFVRHVHVSCLSKIEKECLFEKSPTLADAIIAGGAKLENLVTNPFNLAMLGELLCAGVNPDSFSTIITRGDILKRYWEERLAEFGVSATSSLKVLTSAMIDSRTIDLPETLIPIDATTTIDNLLRVGVLVQSAFKIEFRHHILFDYAIARLILSPSKDHAKKYLNREKRLGFLIAPAIGYWLEHLKATTSSNEYWEFIVILLNDSTIDPICIVESARNAVEFVKENENLDALVRIFSQQKAVHKAAFNHLTGAIITKYQLKQPVVTSPWAHFLAKLSNPHPELFGYIRSLMIELLAENNPPDVINSLGIAARNLFNILSRNENLIPWLSRHCIKFITQTYGTDPKASHLQLKKIFEPERFARFGHIEVPEFTENIMYIVPYDEEFVVQAYYYVFRGGKFSSEQGTSGGGSYIFSFTSNAAQDFYLAEHNLFEAFPDLLNQFPKIGIRALSSTLLGEYQREHIEYRPQSSFIRLGETDRVFQSDLSHVWAWDIDENQHDGYAKIYQAVISWANSFTDIPIFEEIPNLLLNETGIAICWRTLFDVAAAKPNILGNSIWSVAATPTMLLSPDTSRSSINLIATVYPLLENILREKAEKQWLSYDFFNDIDPYNTPNIILGTLFECIGEAHLITKEAQAFLSGIKKSDIILKNKKTFKIHSNYETGTHPTKSKEEVNPHLILCTKVKDSINLLKQNSSSEDQTLEAWHRVLLLEDSLAKIKEDVNTDTILEVLDTLAEAYGVILTQNGLSDEQTSTALSHLIELTYHSYPSIPDNTEEISLFHPSIFPRLQAANGLACLIKKPEFWPIIQVRYQELLFRDPHPVIRLNLMQSLPQLRYIDKSLMWNVAEKYLVNEKNPQIIRFSGQLLSVLLGQNDSCLEELILGIYKRHEIPSKRDDVIINYIIYFAFVKGFSSSENIISNWIPDYFKYESHLQTVLFEIREKIIIGLNLESKDIDKEKERERTKAFLWALIKELKPIQVQLCTQNSIITPTLEQKIALKLFESIGDQIYCAAGIETLSVGLSAPESQQRFLHEYSEMISVLTSYGTPKTIHHIFKVLKNLIDADPEHCFDLFSEALLRTSGIGRYEHEWLGVDLFVEIISRYLADHRAIFTDERRQTNLIGCLSLFVDSGWPEARKLFYYLPELLS